MTTRHPPILFLDIDGVLAPFQDELPAHAFHPPCVAALRLILSEVPGLKIVFSSTWRLPLYVDQLQGQWLEHGLPAEMTLDGTPDTRRDPKVPRDARRGHEIRLWLEQHPECTDWVAIDDDWLSMRTVLPDERCVYTDPRRGLEVVDAERAIGIFKGSR